MIYARKIRPATLLHVQVGEVKSLPDFHVHPLRFEVLPGTKPDSFNAAPVPSAIANNLLIIVIFLIRKALS